MLFFPDNEIMFSITNGVKLYGHHNNLLDVAGATLLRMSLMMYKGRELTATMTATFQAKRRDVTNARSVTG